MTRDPTGGHIVSLRLTSLLVAPRAHLRATVGVGVGVLARTSLGRRGHQESQDKGKKKLHRNLHCQDPPEVRPEDHPEPNPALGM